MFTHHTSNVTCRFLLLIDPFNSSSEQMLHCLSWIWFSSAAWKETSCTSKFQTLSTYHWRMINKCLNACSRSLQLPLPPKKWDVNAVFCHHLLWLQSHFCQSLFAPKSAARQQAAHIALGIQPSHESAKLSRAARVRRRMALAFKEMGLTERTSTKTNKQTTKQTHVWLGHASLDCCR